MLNLSSGPVHFRRTHRAWTTQACLVRSTHLGSLLPALLVSLVACKGLTNVGGDGLTGPSQFDNPTGAVLRRNAAVASFSGAQSSQVVWSGLISDELTATQSQTAVIDALHITPDNSVGTYPYDALTTARINALRAIQSLKQYAPYPPSRIGQLYAFAGLVELYFAEDMCSGVPLATVVAGVPTAVSVVSRDSLIARALAHFDSASSDITDSGVVNAQVMQLVQVARGRALVDAGKFVAAAAAVSSVSSGFTYMNDEFDGVTISNPLYSEFYTSQLMSVANNEGGTGLDFIAAGDPRAPIANTGTVVGSDSIYAFGPVTATSPIVLASGVEASLIRAEAALQAGQSGAWADTLNALRSSFGGGTLPNIPPDSTTLANSSFQQTVMFRERAFWLFLSGHRHGDQRRLVRQYGRPEATVFPTGSYTRAGEHMTYGTDVTFVPFGETTDPVFHGCIDRTP
jgi:hypothetical protein